MDIYAVVDTTCYWKDLVLFKTLEDAQECVLAQVSRKIERMLSLARPFDFSDFTYYTIGVFSGSKGMSLDRSRRFFLRKKGLSIDSWTSWVMDWRTAPSRAEFFEELSEA